jgi:hypothetical protein
VDSSERPLILGAVGDQHQRRRLRDHREELGQHRLADLIDPMGVFDDIDRRGLACQGCAIDQRGQAPPPRIRVDLGQRNVGIGDAQQVIKQRQVLGVRVANPGTNLGASHLRIKALDTKGRAQQALDL